MWGWDFGGCLGRSGHFSVLRPTSGQSPKALFSAHFSVLTFQCSLCSAHFAVLTPFAVHTQFAVLTHFAVLTDTVLAHFAFAVLTHFAVLGHFAVLRHFAVLNHFAVLCHFTVLSHLAVLSRCGAFDIVSFQQLFGKSHRHDRTIHPPLSSKFHELSCRDRRSAAVGGI